LIAATLLLVSLGAGAQTFPARQVTIVVPYPPGSTADLMPRALAPLLTQSMGVPVIVENRPGAGGNLGAALVAKGEASGHTLLSATSLILATSKWLYKDLQYDPDRDLTPVINAVSTPNMMVAHPSTGFSSLNDVIRAAKAKPGSLTFASGSNGSTSHLCGELLKVSAGIDMVHVPYKGPGPAMQDLLAGHVPFMCDNFSIVIPNVRSGKLRAIALTAPQRHPQAPEVPTTAEAGVPGLEIGIWYGFAVPSATPRPVVQKLNAEIARALRNPPLAARFESLGLAIIADSPEEFARFAAAESAKMRKLVQDSGARID